METFDLLWAMGQQILDFQTPSDELSNPDPGPSQRTQGWHTSAKGDTIKHSYFHMFSHKEGGTDHIETHAVASLD